VTFKTAINEVKAGVNYHWGGLYSKVAFGKEPSMTAGTKQACDERSLVREFPRGV
jgi:hypothetical protein